MKNLFKKLSWLLLSLLLSTAVLTGCDGNIDSDDINAALDVLDYLLTETEEGGAPIAPGNSSNIDTPQQDPAASPTGIKEDGRYSSKEDVALYLHTYGHLPDNFLTKNEARDLGWDSDEGNLWKVAKGMSIGGDRFYNNEGLLPKANGRKYYECDIDYEGGYRGAKRIVYSNDGLIYYTDDHYKSFECLYGEE